MRKRYRRNIEARSRSFWSGFEHHAALALGICGSKGVIRIQVHDSSTLVGDACSCDCDDDALVLEEGHGLRRDRRMELDLATLHGHSHLEKLLHGISRSGRGCRIAPFANYQVT